MNREGGFSESQRAFAEFSIGSLYLLHLIPWGSCSINESSQ